MTIDEMNEAEFPESSVSRSNIRREVFYSEESKSLVGAGREDPRNASGNDDAKSDNSSDSASDSV